MVNIVESLILTTSVEDHT